MVYILICLILMALSGIFSVTRQFQMLQQNSYYPSRYYKWMNNSYVIELCFCSCLFCLCSVLISANKALIATIISAFILIIRIFRCLNTQKKSIKPLVFTSRIKRLYAAAIIIIAALITVFFFTQNTLLGEIMKISCLALSFISPALMLISWIITYPLEKAFGFYYISDAKRILKNHTNLKVIGITGSFGKTTTKFILNRILSEKYNTVCTPQSFNTPMGVVRTIRESIKPKTQIFICEMGAKNKGDIKEICDIVNPDCGIITSVGAQHLETFKSVDNVFETKFELADAIKKKGGFTLINNDSPDILSRYDKTDNTLIPFGNDTDYRAQNIRYGPDGSKFRLYLNEEVLEVTTKLLGLHSVADIVAAAAMAYKLGVKADDIKFAIAALKATEHRLELKPFKNGSLLIDDAYNSNPVGCLEAVRVLGCFDGMQKTVITPGLIELGDKEYECNYQLALECTKYCDIIILVGKNRAKPMLDAIDTTNFNKDKVFVAAGFAEAMQIYSQFITNKSVVLLENDLPDNYLN
ncbi:MAG: UDP-N-acetylmuramoyl-tripeptide--D-alanyl-D-alanine ligase [Clostridia bacterium]|nr:UDP-N-acetylmuramoyl-tripeptide--D-alanyl-D-alanine ligase [Clostridia bacterium]